MRGAAQHGDALGEFSVIAQRHSPRVKACNQERDEAAKRIDIVSEGGSLASLLLGRDEACSSLHEKTFPLAGRIRHLKIEQPGMAGLVDANIPRRQIAVNYPRRVQGPERF